MQFSESLISEKVRVPSKKSLTVQYGIDRTSPLALSYDQTQERPYRGRQSTQNKNIRQTGLGNEEFDLG